MAKTQNPVATANMRFETQLLERAATEFHDRWQDGQKDPVLWVDLHEAVKAQVRRTVERAFTAYLGTLLDADMARFCFAVKSPKQHDDADDPPDGYHWQAISVWKGPAENCDFPAIIISLEPK